jgi:hypothetical protein
MSLQHPRTQTVFNSTENHYRDVPMERLYELELICIHKSTSCFQTFMHSLHPAKTFGTY